jgi:hypothetical protein
MFRPTPRHPATPRPQVSPQNANRMVDGARGVLNALLADVYVFTDSASGAAAGASPGYGAVLVAETTSGCLVSAEACATQASAVVRGWRAAGAGPGGAPGSPATPRQACFRPLPAPR